MRRQSVNRIFYLQRMLEFLLVSVHFVSNFVLKFDIKQLENLYHKGKKLPPKSLRKLIHLRIYTFIECEVKLTV